MKVDGTHTRSTPKGVYTAGSLQMKERPALQYGPTNERAPTTDGVTVFTPYSYESHHRIRCTGCWNWDTMKLERFLLSIKNPPR